jgi:hypothetical protein
MGLIYVLRKLGSFHVSDFQSLFYVSENTVLAQCVVASKQIARDNIGLI